MWVCLVHLHGCLAYFLLTFCALVGVPFVDVLFEKVHNVFDVASHISTSDETSLSQSAGLVKQILRLNVESRSTAFPEYVMNMDHSARWRPLVNCDV